MTDSFNILVTSAGRRVSLVHLFKHAIARLGLRGAVYGADVSNLAAAWRLADRRAIVPPCTSPDFVSELLWLCSEENIRLLVPTIDTELPVLAAHRESFSRIGTTVVISSPETVEIAADKARLNDWLRSEGFPTVRQTSPANAAASRSDWSFPLIAKPQRGSSSNGVMILRDLATLETLADRNDYIVEKMAPGTEHTIDVLVDRSGRVTCTVPRRRLEVRAGEVSKGVTVKSRAMESLARQIAERLPGAFGVLNLQMFSDGDELRVIEINARFGGGFPLSAHAGADFPRWLIEEAAGMPSTASADQWEGGVVMLRYDAEVFFRDETV